jgi:hypothetical protein
MAEITDISGVGPARASSFEEMGYETVEDLADADPEELATADNLTEDRALEFVVEAQNMSEEDDADETDDESREEFDLKPSEISDEVEQPDDTEDSEDSVVSEESSEDDESPSVEQEPAESESDAADETDSYPVELTFDNRRQFDTFHAAIMRHHERVFTSDQPAADTMAYCLGEIDGFGSVEYELSENGLNELHSAVLQQRTNYQGDNLIEHMDELREVEEQVNDLRSEYLF